MRQSKSRNRKPAKQVLALPDLEQSKAAVLNSLTSGSGQRTYDHAIREFVAWYCSEPRLSFNRTVFSGIGFSRETPYAPTTIDLRLAAVRRVAFEAADAGLLSPELAAGIRRVKGVRRLGVRIGNWLTPEQGRRLLEHEAMAPRGISEHAILALVGLGSAEANCSPSGRIDPVARGALGHRRSRGKGGHIRTVPIPAGSKPASRHGRGRRNHGAVFRAIGKGRPGMGKRDDAEGALGHREGCRGADASTNWPLTTSGEPVPDCATWRAENWIRFNFSLGTSRFRRPSGISGASRSFAAP